MSSPETGRDQSNIKNHDIKGWSKIGSIVVDSGCVVIGDPHNVFEYSDDQLVNACLEERALPNVVLSETGLGDGEYDVEARYEEVPRYGRKIAEIRIKFEPTERIARWELELKALRKGGKA